MMLKHEVRAAFGAVWLVAVVLSAGCAPGDEANDATGAADAAPVVATPIAHGLKPLPGLENSVPTLTRKNTVRLETTAGNLVVEVYPEAAPNAARRFVELARAGFYDDTPVSRVVPGFVAQFGVNWREPHRARQDDHFADDPTLFALEPGTLAFAKAGPNTNSTQVFINYRNNNDLAAPRYNFTVFGNVVAGMEVANAFLQVGHPSDGLDQGRLWGDGAAYLESLATKPTMIVRAVVID